jgi:hypothetical protein
MSRRNVLAQEKPHYACELCGEEILHDVVRVDGGRIYHMRCFNQRVNAGKRELRECPTCQTLGALWNWDHSQWNECDVCKGTGYMAGGKPVRGSSRDGPEPLAAC